MQQALRPYATAGVALVGAGLIASVFAVTQTTAPSPGIPHVNAPAIQLTAGDPNVALENLISTLDSNLNSDFTALESDFTSGLSALESGLTTGFSGLGVAGLDSDLVSGFSTLDGDLTTLDSDLTTGFGQVLEALVGPGSITNLLQDINNGITTGDLYLQDALGLLGEIVTNTGP